MVIGGWYRADEPSEIKRLEKWIRVVEKKIDSHTEHHSNPRNYPTHYRRAD